MLLVAGENERTMHSIIPLPQHIVESSSHFKITSTTKIVLGTNTPTLNFAAEQFNEELLERKETALKIVDEESIRKLSSNFIFIGLPNSEYGKKLLKERKGTLTREMKAEGYFLDVNANGVVIIAESEKGLLYGMMSLVQIINTEKRSVAIPCGTIQDYPSEKIRGITDDISRGQISTMENFKKIIRLIARYKMNVYSPYIEDMFQFKNYPDIGKERGALSAKECRELDAYAKKYFVEMIPIFETLGHWENILLNPKYAGLGEFPGAHTINISDEKALAMLDEMIGEIAGCFSSPYFNIAADESWDVGLGANKSRVKKSDLATVHAEHYQRVFAMVKKHGKIPLMYGDIILLHPEILSKIPKEVTFVDWHYGPAFDYTSPEIFKKAGFPFIVCPAVWSFGGPFPNFLNTTMNIQNLNLDGFQNGSLGMLCSNWNDFGGEALRELNYYGYGWAAECAWNPTNADLVSFEQKFFMDFYGLDETDAIRSVYALLNNPANQYHWYELWRHPMLPNRDNMVHEVRVPLIQRMQSIKTTMPFVLSLLEKLKSNVTRNADHLRNLEFVAKLNLWFAKKIETQERVKLAVRLADSTTVREELAKKISSLAENIVSSLTDVKADFQKVWAMSNKPQNIDRLLQRYDRQISYWNELRNQVQRGDFVFSPEIKSQWIYHPEVNDSVQVQHAWFRRSFELPGAIRSAKLQLMGDSWVKLYVNGKSVGEVYARGSLSLMVEMERAKIFDIAPFLNDSTNIIAVEANNFEEHGSAGTNICGEIVTSDGMIFPLRSDTTWVAVDSLVAGWNKNTYTNSWRRHAIQLKKSVPIVAPDLSTGRTSWFER